MIFLIPRHLSKEIRSLVDFQIGNEHFIAHSVHFLFENQSLVDFQIGNEQVGAICMKMVIFPKENASATKIVILYLKIDHWSIFK